MYENEDSYETIYEKIKSNIREIKRSIWNLVKTMREQVYSSFNKAKSCDFEKDKNNFNNLEIIARNLSSLIGGRYRIDLIHVISMLKFSYLKEIFELVESIEKEYPLIILYLKKI